jgi:hypothetical protein
MLFIRRLYEKGLIDFLDSLFDRMQCRIRCESSGE